MRSVLRLLLVGLLLLAVWGVYRLVESERRLMAALDEPPPAVAPAPPAPEAPPAVRFPVPAALPLPGPSPAPSPAPGAGLPALPGLAPPAGGLAPQPDVVTSMPGRGTITVHGWFQYSLPAAPARRNTVSIAVTIDCAANAGTLTYRDRRQRVEWRSSRFVFDAAPACAGEREDLKALANTFDASIDGTYTRLRARADAQSSDFGLFHARFHSTDAAGNPLPRVVFCLSFVHGPFADYVVPQSVGNPPADAGCTHLGGFQLRRRR